MHSHAKPINEVLRWNSSQGVEAKKVKGAEEEDKDEEEEEDEEEEDEKGTYLLTWLVSEYSVMAV